MRLVPTLAEESMAADSAAEPLPASAATAGEHWPAEVDMILSAMEAAGAVSADRRDGDRSPHHTRAELRLFAHDPLSLPTPLFTRDISPTGIGFITKDRLPLGYGGVVSFVQEDGTKIAMACTIFRCRPLINGWFEGALHFTN